MPHTIKTFIIVMIFTLCFSCKNSKITDKDFSYIIIFSDVTEYFFKIKNTPFIQEETLFINEKDIEIIKDKLNNVKKYS
ncbi:Hypothetical protein BHY_0203 [Borrelia nietonii YOR]|uniref:Lipoprotein n=1 Tax=Borrelia nietonii YOR TaxID=1293576 RepID=A0ABM5PHR5_9SPIR|nr:hypothetical protein [Borrelia nietonii]AHH03154.1 Hypothetical protein BHY_0203 [Borrelia nietonii YOR]